MTDRDPDYGHDCGPECQCFAPRPEPQFLGSGATDFQQCDDCAWDICGQAKACLRRECRT